MCGIYLMRGDRGTLDSGENEGHQLGFPVPLREFPFCGYATVGVFYSIDGELLLRFGRFLLLS
jgi:hypothetical protein